VLLLAALIATLALAACGGGEEETVGGGPAPTEATPPAAAEPAGGDSTEGSEAGPSTPTIAIEDGEPVGGIAELEYDAGDEIEFTVESDVAEEIHVHGYDLMKDVPAGGSVTFSFPAEIEGIFEVEMEGRAVQIAEIRVNP
jgi:hypothetical protein